jgi:glycerate-2-kinase
VEGCQKIIDMCETLNFQQRDLVITATGNGVSSLMTLPVDELTLAEIQEITRIVQIELGLSTIELNYIRNHVDKLKSGRINRWFGKAHIVNVAVRDINNPITGVFTHGYGYEAFFATNQWLHNLPDRSTYGEALDTIAKHKLEKRLSPNVMAYLHSQPPQEGGMMPEEFLNLPHARMFGICPPARDPTELARKKALETGMPVHVLNKYLHCEATPTADYVGRLAVQCAAEGVPFQAPCVILSSGELLVRVGKSKGVGGRNQEYGLSAAVAIDGCKRVVIAAADTDGTDGPGGYFDPDAHEQGVDCWAGAVVDGYTLERVREKGMDIYNALSTHDTSAFLWRLGDGIHTTQSISLADIHVIVVMDEDG